MEKLSKKKRHSYTREFKLKVSDWYMNNVKNITRTAQMFGADRKQVTTWLKNEEIIQRQKHSSKASGRGCTTKYPIMDDALVSKNKWKIFKMIVVQFKGRAVTKRSLPW